MKVDVKTGQIWADKDGRRKGRQLRVEKVEDGVAEVTSKNNETAQFGNKRTRIKVGRFARYALINDIQEGQVGILEGSSEAVSPLASAA